MYKIKEKKSCHYSLKFNRINNLWVIDSAIRLMDGKTCDLTQGFKKSMSFYKKLKTIDMCLDFFRGICSVDTLYIFDFKFVHKRKGRTITESRRLTV